MSKLKVLSEYRSREIHYLKGTVIEVDEVWAEFLMRDAPGCFEEVGVGKAPRGPAVDKMIDEGDGLDKLGVRELRKRLKAAGLKQAGRKPSLISRLRGG